jgi:hypothetical protein
MPLAFNFFQKQTQYSIFYIKNVGFEVALNYYKFVCLSLKDFPHTAVPKTFSIDEKQVVVGR